MIFLMMIILTFKFLPPCISLSLSSTVNSVHSPIIWFLLDIPIIILAVRLSILLLLLSSTDAFLFIIIYEFNQCPN